MLSGKKKGENKEATDELFLKSHYTCSFTFKNLCEAVVQEFRHVHAGRLLITGNDGGDDDAVVVRQVAEEVVMEQ